MDKVNIKTRSMNEEEEHFIKRVNVPSIYMKTI